MEWVCMKKEKKEKNRDKSKVQVMPKQKGDKRHLALNSIRGKLFTLGTVSIATTIILGITGINLINSNNSNNEVMTNVNNINLLQNENQTLEVSFLYHLDNEYYKNIQTNLQTMSDNAGSAKKGSSLVLRKDLETVSDSINELLENTKTLLPLYENRGFQDTQGMYAEFAAQDEAFAAKLSELTADAEWLDCPWNEISLASLPTVKIGGKEYKYIRYESEIAFNKRNYIIPRVGGDTIGYSGKIYINNICFDGKEQMDLSGLKAEDFGKSFGDAYSDLQTETFNKLPSISYKANFPKTVTEWTEASIQFPLGEHDNSTYKKVSYDLYFEAPKEDATIKIAMAFNERYNFTAKLEELNTLMKTYSKSVAEGTEASGEEEAIRSLIKEISTNLSLYLQDGDALDEAKKVFQAKSDAFEKIVEYDQDILAIKAENNKLNEQVTLATTDIRDLVEKETEESKTSTTTLITVVFLVGMILVVILLLFVMISVQKSIKNFKRTLDGIADGDMTMKAETGKGGEFDVFGRSLNQMTDKLKEILGSVNSITGEVQTSGADLKEMAQTTNNTSEQIDISIAGIAQGAIEQAKDVEESTYQISNLGDLMDNMVDNISDLDNASTNMKNASDEAIVILEELSTSNDKMTEGIHKIAEQIYVTNDSVQEIEEAVSLISSIAGQTNLLSLNASIEAARAGEAGKGFAVVASEIQQLAEQSNSSANTISEVIRNLMNNFEIAMQTMNEVEKATEEQNKKLAQTQAQFTIVTDGITQSRNKTSVLKTAIEECHNVRLTVSQLMINLSAISEENAASTTETANAMQTLNQTMAELLGASQRLMDISAQLENDMQFFQL